MTTNKPVIIKLKRLAEEAIIPQYAHAGDAGADIYALETCTLEPLQRKAIATGLSVEIPPGFEIQVRPKSGLALKHGITVLNTPGTIDAGYRGEIKVILINLGSESYVVEKGQKIAQLVTAVVERVEFREIIEDLSSSLRGEGGFGSTGV
ncbi:MAG: dUTP diphosphatase [Coleofasciculaceae cyanobacterium SM2_1_6]|nr:dUTP diphosphatase [Coleofasciculaceae cyanobacterium SM2_1_6]